MDDFERNVHACVSKWNKHIKHEETSSNVHHTLATMLVSRYISRNMSKKITELPYIKTVIFTVKKTRVQLTTMSKSTEHHTDFFVNYTTNCITVIEGVFKKTTGEIKIILALTDEKKRLPTKSTSTDKVFTAEHINSGLTLQVAKQAPVILVYRKDEICKVILHELLHAYSIHRSSYSSAIDEFLIHSYHISLRDRQTLNIYESYVEALALVINSVMYNKLFNDPKAFEKETAHQLQTVHQINSVKPYAESTNVFAYVHLKYSVLTRLDSILKALKPNNYSLDKMELIMPPKNMRLSKNKCSYCSSNIRLNKMDIFKTYLKIQSK